MADKWYIDTIKNSSLRKLLDYDAQEIILQKGVKAWKYVLFLWMQQLKKYSKM